jgi:NAD-dependent SIR2 family protein deacetylase
LCEDGGVNDLHDFVARHRRLFVLSGAGVSTESGIPGYRDADGNWQRRPPITVQEFLRSTATRRRYWARGMIGWPRIAQARPNAAHRALARLERALGFAGLVTQNVDGLHQRAGSADVVELHGNLARVVCLDCGAVHARDAIQRLLEDANPGFADERAPIAPDGDADVDADLDSFAIPECPRCGGNLKPDVVFFGENVPRERVAAAMRALDEADAMLVVGSSLMVYSGFRFCERAAALSKPIAAINRGRTRADALFAVKVDAWCGEALSALAERCPVSA